VGAVPGGAARPGQQQMAAAIEESVTSGEHLLVQAGTGTGKSLAYLAPALTVDGPVVVSTATLALQSQLVDHDLPRLADAVEPVLGRRPTFAVLKGRHHYLCLARLDNSTEEEPEDTLFDAPARPPGGRKVARRGGSARQAGPAAARLGGRDRHRRPGRAGPGRGRPGLAAGVDAGAGVRRGGPLPVR
jgi:ATP-dependent DNA helicase DinG